MQILPQNGPRCHRWLSCSKKPRGQTRQVNRCQSDRVHPRTRPLPSKNTPSSRQTVILPNAAGLGWFTASVHSPYKHFIHMSSSRPPVGGWVGDFKRAAVCIFKNLSTPLLYTWADITHGMLMMGFLYLCHQNVAPNTPLVLSWSTFTVRCDCLS